MAFLDDILTGSWRLRDPMFWASVASAGLVVIVLVVRRESWRRFWEEEQEQGEMTRRRKVIKDLVDLVAKRENRGGRLP